MRLLKSFGYAFKGIATAFKEQLNFKIHLLAVIVVAVLGWWFKLDIVEWCIIILTCALVLVAEMVNTAIEYLVDLVSPQQNPLAGKIKDIAAGAVLIAAIAAVIIGILIFSDKYVTKALEISL